MDEKKISGSVDKAVNNKPHHTWIGDAEEIRPDYSEDRPVARQSYAARDTSGRGTRVAEREKRPYRGFITDEEVQTAEKNAEAEKLVRDERRARAKSEMSRTRVYSGFDSVAGETDEKRDAIRAKDAPARHRRISIDISDRKKFRRFAALLAVFAVLLAFEISFFVMKAKTSSMPEHAEKMRQQTAELEAGTEELKQQAAEYGEYDQVKELRDSWQRLRDKLAE